MSVIGLQPLALIRIQVSFIHLHSTLSSMFHHPLYHPIWLDIYTNDMQPPCPSFFFVFFFSFLFLKNPNTYCKNVVFLVFFVGFIFLLLSVPLSIYCLSTISQQFGINSGWLTPFLNPNLSSTPTPCVFLIFWFDLIKTQWKKYPHNHRPWSREDRELMQ